MKNIQTIGKVLKDKRENKNLTIEDVYRETHIHPGLLRDIESGRAPEDLSDIYLKSFLKKYAAFLGLDISSKLREAARQSGEEKKDNNARLDMLIEGPPPAANRYINIVLSAAVVLIFFVFVFTGVNRIKSALFKKGSRAKTGTASVEKKRDNIIIAASKKAVAPAAEKIVLSLKTSDDVWIRVKKDGETVFKSTLPRGDTESWTAKDSIDLRVGKLESVTFNLNGRDLGKLGFGTKNVRIDAKGVHID